MIVIIKVMFISIDINFNERISVIFIFKLCSFSDNNQHDIVLTS